MAIDPLPGSFSQVTWPGVGDIDECWIIATYWAIVAAGHRRKNQLPTILAFRDVANRPDAAGPTGGTRANILAGVRGTMPDTKPIEYVGSYEGFLAYLKRGAVASLVVNSGKLPSAIRFGFNGTHQVAVALVGNQLKIMNPLAPDGHEVYNIVSSQLKPAAYGYNNDTKFYAVIFNAVPVDTHVTEIAKLSAQVTAQSLQIAAMNAKATTLQAKIDNAKAALA
jgi:hypothetical protein